jgi:hypothetical protein
MEHGENTATQIGLASLGCVKFWETDFRATTILSVDIGGKINYRFPDSERLSPSWPG